ncbi:plectin-like [Dendronephthya gigantea]|uniref:plectin-like n=1 Tax=Dendronephthya gigantea TaxID=151771 RepID=UPI00106DAF77|nr:plectin-like [Dendronephthya gigantea]
MASYRSERRDPLLSLEQMLAEKTTLRTQKVTHRNIICIGTDLLKEIEAFMNSDKNEAVKKAITETEMKLLEERKNIIDEIIENMARENTESLEKARKQAEKEIEIVKYRCEVAEKKRTRLAQQKYEKEKQIALQEAEEEARRLRKDAVEMAEHQLREIMLAEGEEKTRTAVEKTKYKLEEESKIKISDAVKYTREQCDRTAAARLSEVEKKHKEEITVLKTRLKDLVCDFQRQKNEKEEYENLFTELREDYKRFQNYTQGFCSDYLMK